MLSRHKENQEKRASQNSKGPTCSIAVEVIVNNLGSSLFLFSSLSLFATLFFSSLSLFFLSSVLFLSSLSYLISVSRLNDDDSDHWFSKLSLWAQLWLSLIVIVRGAVAPSLLGELVRIMQKHVFRCACAWPRVTRCTVAPVPALRWERCLPCVKICRWSTVCHVVVCGMW